MAPYNKALGEGAETARMPDIQDKSITNSIARYIRTARKQVTILFTDIEYSTLLWDVRGDIEGRLMVDKHNRLLFPVVRAYRGRVLKTIGDAIMASFRTPEDALKAAIGIQQALQRAREEDESFYLKVRIGMHTGMAIVEHNDVFGDVVNMASRIENEAAGDEILLSEATAENLKNKGYFLVEEGTFVFKGKRAPMTVYRCEWQLAPDMIEAVRFESFLPVGTRQKIDLLIYALAGLFSLYFLYTHLARYVLADSEALALLVLNPQFVFDIHPLIPALFAALALGALVFLRRMRRVPLTLLRLLKGGYGFCVAFFLVYLPLMWAPAGAVPMLDTPLYRSEHLFVEVLQDRSPVFAAPDLRAEALRWVRKGNLMLLADQSARDDITWNRVRIDERGTGWIPETVPAREGVPETRFSLSKRFVLTLGDVLALAAGLVGFVWGALRFRVQPF